MSLGMRDVIEAVSRRRFAAQAGFDGLTYFAGSAVNFASQDLLQNQYSCPS